VFFCLFLTTMSAPPSRAATAGGPIAGGASLNNNPGHVLASAVDAEVAKYRGLQSEVERLRSDLAIVRSQETETELVEAELKLIANHNSNNTSRGGGRGGGGGSSSTSEETIYKMVGPVLIRQDADEAVQTVGKRLEFIRGEKEKITGRISSKERQLEDLSAKIQGMQTQLQHTTAAAIQAISQQHQQAG
jgi:prefoldin beta subunit